MHVNRCLNCMRETEKTPCPHCGFDPNKQPQQNYALDYGSILNGRYLVGRVIGQGGFGITYVGFDLALELKVAIKEYYPSGSVMRDRSWGPGLHWATTDQAKDLRQNGMATFLKEARKMARIDHLPGVVRVRDTFQENGTAYIAMEYIEGETLKDRLRRSGPMPWEKAKEFFLPAIATMQQVHERGMIHRDISPDNLMLTPNGGVCILDLGAAKDLTIGNGMTSTLVAKTGFSPVEQYAQQGGSGTWTDVYAMAATVYYTLSGVVPPSAVDRVGKDALSWDLPQLTALPANVKSALQNALRVQAGDRTQTMAQLLEQLQDAHEPAPQPVPTEPTPQPVPRSVQQPAAMPQPNSGTAQWTACGSCGETLSWGLSADGTLVISGSGEMTDYSYVSSAPWFSYRERIRLIAVEAGVTTIGRLAFHGLFHAATASLPDGLLSVKAFAFKGCQALSHIEIPYSVGEIQEGAFANCYVLTAFYLPRNHPVYTVIDGVLFAGRGKTLVEYPAGRKGAYRIPDGVTDIYNSAFYGSLYLTAVTFPRSVAVVGEGAFGCCASLKEVTLPTSVQEVGKEAFQECGKLKKVTADVACKFGENAIPKDAALLCTQAGGNTVVAQQGKKRLPWKWLTLGIVLTVLLMIVFFSGTASSKNRSGANTLSHTHTWRAATCISPKTCANCGETQGSALGHSWTDATCTSPKTCTRCGKTQGSALGHSWTESTCTGPGTCTRCGETQGTALGHDWADATCTEPQTCTRCGETQGSALGHSWKEATYEKPKTCTRCGLTDGDVKGYYAKFDAEWSSVVKDIGGTTQGHTMILEREATNCRQFTVHYEITDIDWGSVKGDCRIWVYTDKWKWKEVGKISVDGIGTYTATIIFDTPVTFSEYAIAMPVNSRARFYSYYYLYNVYLEE